MLSKGYPSTTLAPCSRAYATAPSSKVCVTPAFRKCRATKKQKSLHVGVSGGVTLGMVLDLSSRTYVSRGAIEHQPTG